MHFYVYINFGGCFFCGSLQNPVVILELFNWSASKAWPEPFNWSASKAWPEPFNWSASKAWPELSNWSASKAWPELSNWSVSKAWQVLTTKNPKILTKRPPVAPQSRVSPQAPSAIIGALVYRGIPSYLRSRPEQSHHLPGSLLPR